MAKKTDTTSTFRTLAGFTAFLLVLAGALVYLQSSGGGGAGAELAALSQSLPADAHAVQAGEDGAIDKLDTSLKRLASLRRSAGPSAPGSSDDWRDLEASAGALVAARDSIGSVNGARAAIMAAGGQFLGASETLLDRSGATSVIQQVQQRSARLVDTARGLPSATDTSAAIASMSNDAAYLANAINGLDGRSTSLDVRALGAADREELLMPLKSALQDINDGMTVIGANGDAITTIADAVAGVESSAASLMQSGFGSSGGLLPGALASPFIPIVILLIGAILVVVLVFMNRKMATFERAAAEQAEQNERNQQAILRLLDEMGSLADGDLTIEATVTEDITGTIADSFNYAIEELRKLVAAVNETAITVEAAARQTETAAGNMARAADNQAKEINAATESIVSMAASIEEVSGNAERSSDVARHSVEVAHKGGEAVRRTIDGMNTIRETIQDTSKRIKRLGESSQEIGNIVELINDIAEQTNILALNASIQASMAGEAGRGFAVVADEVQRLAERSTNATKQIEVLVSTIQADTKEAVISMERSTTDVVGGALLAENAGAALDEIEQVSNQIASLVQNISGSARQQAGSAADVTRRTARLREIGEQTGKATTATANAISKLAEFASQLRQSVAGFTLPGGNKPVPPVNQPAPPAAAPPKPAPAQPGKQATG